MPPVPFRYVLNTLLYILITGCRWCDVPQGDQWASKSSSYAKRYTTRVQRPLGHRWLKRWREDGTLDKLQSRILGIAQNKGMINWDYGAVDGSFSPWTHVAVKQLLMAIKEKEF